MQPQLFVQQYVREKHLFPKNIVDQIEQTEADTKESVKRTDQKRANQHLKNLAAGKERYKNARKENRRLGRNSRVYWADKVKFRQLVSSIGKRSIDNLLEEKSPKEWRQFIVRMVCTATGSEGAELRKVWQNVYTGDLSWGVRDMRLQHRINQPKKKGQGRLGDDRNTWIASCLRRSLCQEKERTNKNKDV